MLALSLNSSAQSAPTLFDAVAIWKGYQPNGTSPRIDVYVRPTNPKTPTHFTLLVEPDNAPAFVIALDWTPGVFTGWGGWISTGIVLWWRAHLKSIKVIALGETKAPILIQEPNAANF